jgi:SpoVK/Ycf46/Vps4 family AAA+-type ATPase
MLSGVWKLPLMRLDMGALFSLPASDVQERLGAAIARAEKFSPCVLWLSGLHNSYTGYGFPREGDARSVGPLLTWMREHRSPVHVVATLDDISAVPPVLMYSFERVFLLDIPHAAERRAIFLIHLRRSGVVLVERRLCLDELVERSQGFTGSEIERVVRESQFAAFRDGCREIEHSDLQRSLSEIVPLGRLYAEAMKKTGRWMTDGGALPASADPPGSQADGGRVFDV